MRILSDLWPVRRSGRLHLRERSPCPDGPACSPRCRRRAGSASTAGGDDFTSTIEDGARRGRPAGAPAGGAGSPRRHRARRSTTTDQPDAVDARAAEDRRRDRRARAGGGARRSWWWSSRGRCRTGSRASTSRSSPSRPTNAVGESVYQRSAGARVSGVGNCGRFRDADAAQRAFLAGGGPEQRPLRRRPRRRRLRLPLGPGALPRAQLSAQRARVQRRRVAGGQRRAHVRAA